MLPEVRLVKVTRDDVTRMAEWLQDEEVHASWYGTDEQGEPLHIGYSPRQMLDAPDRNGRSFSAAMREGSSRC